MLDISRLVSRAGRTQTGIDRVELAYLQQFLDYPVPCYFLVRSPLGYIILDDHGGEVVADAVLSSNWGSPDLLSMLARRRSDVSRSAYSLVRRHRLARCRYSQLGPTLATIIPGDVDFYSVGHVNLDKTFLTALKSMLDVRINVMIHDSIPLDFPETQRPQVVKKFKDSLRNVSEMADRVITISNSARADIEAHFDRFGRRPEIVTAYLGVDSTEPRYAEVPEDLDLSKPYFTIAGTIEPRKNHIQLIEVWSTLPLSDRPQLIICGSRGWLNQTVFTALDRGIQGVIEVPNLSDAAMAAVIHGSVALLTPSIAEGFGLTPMEAAANGVRIVCSDIPVFHELLGDQATYIDAFDVYSWKETIKSLSTNKEATPAPKINPPTWNDHFGVVLGREGYSQTGG